VLYAGGVPETLNKRLNACYYTDWFRPVPAINQYGYAWTHSWTVAECQRQMMSYYSDYFLLVFWSVGDLLPGDILQMDLDHVGTPTHSRVMIGPGIDLVTGASWSNLYDQHTADRKHRGWGEQLPGDVMLWKWDVTY
jgi:hypothetical protein